MRRANLGPNGRKPFSVVRDPIHGDVLLTSEELALVDTREFQRLRGVRQLGAAHLVFPSAVHTRFEHSIGTLHVTRKLIEAARTNAELDPRRRLAIPEEEARVIRIAALVHDVTHMPYGHGIEDQSGLFARHDTAARYERVFDPRTGLGRALADLGVREDVLAILAPGHGAREVPPYWTELVSGTVCGDLLDYLARDAYFTGLRLAVDERVVSYFEVDRKSGALCIDLGKRNLLREDILSEIVRLLDARYSFGERVYFHHAKLAAEAMLARALASLLELGHVEPAETFDTTDASLLALLLARAERAAPAERSRLERLLGGVADRRLFKRAAVFPLAGNEHVQADLVATYFARDAAPRRHAAERRIEDAVRFATGRDVAVLVYCPAATMQLKEAQTHVRWPGTHEPSPLGRHAAAVPRLTDLERAYKSLWKFYVFADSTEAAVLAKVQAVALEEFAGATNAYRVG
jgi:hypothetical protein